MRVLYVNWVDYLDAEARGGGVSLYQRNIMAGRVDRDMVFLASGTSYDLRKGAPRWEQIRHGPDKDRSRRFEIVNSGVLAPGHFSFGAQAQVSDPATEAVFFDFIEQNGPFDVVHFNNLEGLPAGVLTLRSRFPDTRVIFSLHNYYPFCPQVNLWHRERAHCTDFENGAACHTCLPVRPSPQAVRLAAGLAYWLKCAGLEPGKPAFDWTLRLVLGLGRRGLSVLRTVRRNRVPVDTSSMSREQAHRFAARRVAMVEALNSGCDRILCVSDAVRDMALAYGVNPDLVRTSYIGTAQADHWDTTTPRALPGDGTLTLAYLGYMRRDKGFFFLLDALEQAPDVLLARLRLVVAARAGDPVTMARLHRLRSRLAALDWHDGYSHDGLNDLLLGVDMGVIPVLWADNLPQVAVEMHARHIPLLCSDMGGAQELARCPAMTFASGNTADFQSRLAAAMDGKVNMDDYWKAARKPVTVAEHLSELEAHYAA